MGQTCLTPVFSSLQLFFSTPMQLKAMKPEEYRLLMRNLELHYQDFMRDSQDSQVFGPDDRMQVEEDYTTSTQHFDSLLRSMEKGRNGFPKEPVSFWQFVDIQLNIQEVYSNCTLSIHLSGQMVVRLKGEWCKASEPSWCVHSPWSLGWGV